MKDDSKEMHCYGMDRYSWQQGKNAQYAFTILEDKEPGIITRGGSAVAYAVKKKKRPKAYTLKIRSGRETDKEGHSAGKGALIQTNLSATLQVLQDQYLFAPVKKKQDVIAVIEGNGTRPSHLGLGISTEDKMYTLNSTEVHGVVVRKEK